MHLYIHTYTHNHRRTRDAGGKLPTGGAILKILRRHVDIKAALQEEKEEEEVEEEQQEPTTTLTTPSRRRRERGEPPGKILFRRGE